MIDKWLTEHFVWKTYHLLHSLAITQLSTWTNLIIQNTTHHQIFFEEKKKQQDRTHCIIFSKHQSYTEWSVFLDKTLLVSCSVNGTDTSRPIAA